MILLKLMYIGSLSVTWSENLSRFDLDIMYALRSSNLPIGGPKRKPYLRYCDFGFWSSNL